MATEKQVAFLESLQSQLGYKTEKEMIDDWLADDEDNLSLVGDDEEKFAALGAGAASQLIDWALEKKESDDDGGDE